MLPLLTRQDARDADRHAIHGLGVPGLVLMENAGRGAFEVIAREHAGALTRVLLVGGPGQNGGDAWVIARHLARVGHAPRAVLVVASGDASTLTGDAAVNWASLVRMGVETRVIAPEEHEALGEQLRTASLVVDGVFGTGLTRSVDGPYAAVIEAINACGAPVVALDLPSGVDADTGQALGAAVRAVTTVTFGAHKRGLLQGAGRANAGRVWLADIGVAVGQGSAQHVLQATDLRALLPARAEDAHKGTAGHVAVIGGEAGKTGAALLAGLGALRAGAGLVTLVAPAAGRAVLEHKVVEMMSAAFPVDRAALNALVVGKRALVVGPGLGFSPEAQALVRTWLADVAEPAVLDADALSLLVDAEPGTLASLRAARGARVLTPHPGEAARLLGVDTREVQADRYGAASELARRSGHVAVLKGAGTVVAAPEGELRVCPYGTPAMGTGGTGDVLAGVVGALLAGGLRPLSAATAGVLLHALAGERAAPGDRGMLASELADAVPHVLRDALTT
ncbi:MAG: NAD(P)H-hydrate dehydratase [Myxococcales bacterium]|nr:NAD(P)H-hydrate dehydratase [Myxococcales bacterium]MCB9626628.1 NAD(P)H-hydrate dehydratase [Sandaracinaceae bacterium]